MEFFKKNIMGPVHSVSGKMSTPWDTCLEMMKRFYYLSSNPRFGSLNKLVPVLGSNDLEKNWTKICKLIN